MISINKYTNENQSLVKSKLTTTFYYNDSRVLIPDLVNVQRNSFQNFI